MITGSADSKPAEARRLGAFGYIPKPLDMAYGDRIVSIALENRRTKRPMRIGESTRIVLTLR